MTNQKQISIFVDFSYSLINVRHGSSKNVLLNIRCDPKYINLLPSEVIFQNSPLPSCQISQVF